ncbi:MAG: thiolase family protein [Rhodoferax sp.]|uniref:thiolase family protein n=1 Tax=Rhodoferax sp. TaxID=50421 RepID=UPI0008BAA7E3|nr:thiolase family protein [Rhodoferax sp.]MDP2679162.1 thiolase family protein [Rhodoferax sp.]OGB58953.1 MAG: acetyl-CoA acetyltransferase [Burkholderiales bacterium RIFOXYD12_FULL_59_19]OGB81667.1 MAG: acetyl-CoA acetyltransferase [Burkholderiales bacterium RIFOXYC12_FULL_60_6]OGB82288.1 MAG: acetyl-CoA acetyltransferase [Burkholderiales bacterium RIFOXYD2_FULL_59_8]
MASKGFFNAFKDVWMLGGMRTPMVDYCGALGHISPTDLGIKAARAALAHTAVPGEHINSVLTGNMAPGDFEQFMLPRHIGLYAGVPQEVPALMAQRICGTGFELFRQAGEQIECGCADVALLVGTENMTRNPIASFTHRTGFKLGAPVEFKDFLWECLNDATASVNMIQTAENLAKQYGISREEVDAFASHSFAKAVAAQESGFHAGEITPVISENFELAGYTTRAIKLQGKTAVVAQDTHARPSPVEVLAKLRSIYPGGVQTGGNSSALVDAAAAAVVASGAYARAEGKQPLARVVGVAVVGVPPEIMGIGPAPAIRLLLERTGLKLDDVGRFEINEAQGAQTLSVGRELGLDLSKLNVNGGAIALGHPLAATGVRLTLTLARELQRSGQRWGVASACIGGGQGIALLLENPLQA